MSVVIVDRGSSSRDRAVASVLESAARGGIDAEVILIRTTSEAGHPAGDRTVASLDVFPLEAAYARNRALDVATAPIVAFLGSELVVATDWVAAIATAFESAPQPAAVIGVICRRSNEHAAAEPGGPRRVRRHRLALLLRSADNIAFDRGAVLDAGGFDRTFDSSSAPADVADLLFRLERAGHAILRDPSMQASATANLPGKGFRRSDAARLGRLVRRHRTPLLAVRYLAALPFAAATPVSRAAAGEELTEAAADVSASALLSRLPDELRTRLAHQPITALQASHPAKTHFVYDVGEEEVLHLYVNPSERLRRGLREREAIRERASVGGIPRLRQSAESVDALWLLEDRVRGESPSPHNVRDWFPRVANWAVGMAGPPGRPLEASPEWARHRVDTTQAAREAQLDAAVGRAFDAVAKLPSRHMHGDLQRKNILVDGGDVGAIDWEGAWLEGMPGLDLVFLALLARGDSPDGSLIPPIARGRDPDWGQVISPLAELRLTPSLLAAALIVMLATWSVAERRRLSRLGAPRAEPVWMPLFRTYVPELAAS